MKTKLRKWQLDAGQAAIERYRAGNLIFVTEACTGAGKTLHGCDVMNRLRLQGMADLVVVVTPSIATRIGWVERLNEIGFNATDRPELFSTTDFDAIVVTYGGVTAVDRALYIRPIHKGIASIVDEYHHGEEDASWGAAIARVAQISSAMLFLSGTPWRSNGQIAVLAQHCNRFGQPYYQSDRVRADYAYTYKEDLEQRDDDRGTIPVQFTFRESQHTDKSGKVEFLSNPHLDQMSPENREIWIKDAMKSDIRIGKHVKTQGQIADFSLSGNALVRSMLNSGMESLRAYRVKARSSVPVLLVVAQSINEARALHNYILNAMTIDGRTVRSALIVSDKDSASLEISEVQVKCKSGLLDVIVSVGMVSEGVDIPQIKGVVYLSAIMTALYIVQVIGRLLRRIRVNDAYMDKRLNDLPGFFIAPAAPKLLAIARRIEDEISEAGGSARANNESDDVEPNDLPTPELGAVETTDDEENVYRGSEDGANMREAVEAMISHNRARECHVDQFWAEWILSMVLSGDKSAKNEALRQIEDRCNCLGIELNDLFRDTVHAAGVTLTMEQQHKIASREAEAVRQRIRAFCNPYSQISDSSAAYRQIAIDVRQRCFFSKSWSFTTATLDEKRRWLDQAHQLLKVSA
jgi:superfamily II DNA or RNA helicase